MLAVFPAVVAFATLIAVTDPQPAAHGASCAVESRPASIVKPVSPEYPEIARLDQVSGRTIVRVMLDDGGRITGADVYKSSGSAFLDTAAVRAAKAMTYAPEIRACASVAGSYAVELNFQD